jgi:hypothetical protein
MFRVLRVVALAGLTITVGGCATMTRGMTVAASMPDAAAFAQCKAAATAQGASCVTGLGVLKVVNGGYPSRLAFADKNLNGGAVCQPGLLLPCEYMPAAAGQALGGGLNKVEALGTYTYCPLRRTYQNTLQVGCLAGAYDVKAQARRLSAP